MVGTAVSAFFFFFGGVLQCGARHTLRCLERVSFHDGYCSLVCFAFFFLWSVAVWCSKHTPLDAPTVLPFMVGGELVAVCSIGVREAHALLRTNRASFHGG